MKGFYYVMCPICEIAVEIQQQDCYYILPLYPANSKLFSHNEWQLGEHSVITIRGLRLSQSEKYPTLEYRQRSFLIHRRCYELVGRPSPSQLRLLIDVVEPTFLPRPLPPPITQGAFSSPDYCILPPIDERLLGRLPLEIQDKILEHDIGRMLFVMRMASQLSNQRGDLEIPEHRFIEEILTLNSNAIRIHLVVVGGRTYISRLSDTPNPVFSLHSRRQMAWVVLSAFLYTFLQKWKHWYIISLSGMTAFGLLLFSPMGLALLGTEIGIDQRMSQDYNLDGSKYLATRSDEMGVIDVAFEQTGAGPKWILNSRAHPFHSKVSVIRYADTRRLRIIRDSLKCRAIIPLNRAGAEPYFCSPLVPPQDSWIDSAFPVESKPTLSHAPLAYFTDATYIPFTKIENIRFRVDPLRLGITKIEVNIPDPHNKLYFVSFARPPRSLRFTLCERTVVQRHTYHIPYLQFEINGQWKPPIPPHWSHSQEPILVENTLGIWWGETFPFIPIHIGVVVSDKLNLKNTTV